MPPDLGQTSQSLEKELGGSKVASTKLDDSPSDTDSHVRQTAEKISKEMKDKMSDRLRTYRMVHKMSDRMSCFFVKIKCQNASPGGDHDNKKVD